MAKYREKVKNEQLQQQREDGDHAAFTPAELKKQGIVAPLAKKKAAVSKRNAAPIINREAFHKGEKSRPFLSITRTDAIIFGAFLAFLLLIALIIYFIMWTANMVTRMQRDHLN